MADFDATKIGVATIIVKDDRILVGKRLSKHGYGTYALPGGHLEDCETPIQCAIREVAEETGLQIQDVVEGPWNSTIFTESRKHYITLFYISKYAGGTPQVLEKDKCLEWIWCKLDELPTPLFKPLETLIKNGFNLQKLNFYLNNKN